MIAVIGTLDRPDKGHVRYDGRDVSALDEADHDDIAGLEALKTADLMVILTRFRELPDDEESAAIVRAVMDLSRALNKTCIAEGIETEQQAAFLRRAGFRPAALDLFQQDFGRTRVVTYGDVVDLALADTLGEERRALEGLSYPGR